MVCYYPIDCYKFQDFEGHYKIVWTIAQCNGKCPFPIQIPCGRCIGCRLERSRQWAIRCVHEAQMHENNCFVTLTVNDENMEDVFPHRSLAKRPFQLFMKRLRKEVGNVRYFQCGEYGEQFARPHYHVCFFGFDPIDKYLWTARDGNRLYRSPLLEKLWPYGHILVGEVTFESAAYVARYIMKKINGSMKYDHYQGRTSEFTLMSRCPGIASSWYEKYKNDVFPHDEMVVRGMKLKPPRYYDKKFDIEDPDGFKNVKLARERLARKHKNNNTPERLAVREVVKQARCKKLIRGYENG